MNQDLKGRLHRGMSVVGTENTEVDMRLPVIEEQAHVEKRLVDRGYIEIRKIVVTEQVMIPVELRREVIEVRRVDAQEAREPIDDAPGAPAPFEPGVIRIPVLREMAVIQKDVVVTSEIVVKRTSVSEQQEIPVSVRRERVSVDRHDQSQTADPGRRPASDSKMSADRSMTPTVPTSKEKSRHDK